ncbi:hypothetical protein ACFE04_031791 [Oxalis oulophora]
MDLAKRVLASIIIATLLRTSLCVVYNVGDSAGWTVMGVDYEQWASTKTFHIGDTIEFHYNNKFHDVMQVTLKEFKLCNVTSEMASYHSGSDSITLDTTGHHYYICGVPGHCQAGQKVDFFVAEGSGSQSPSEAPSRSQSPSIIAHDHSSALSLSYSLVVFGLCSLIAVFAY